MPTDLDEQNGASADADRAGGPDGPEPATQSQPKALIPSAVREVIAEANNSLYGSQGFFLSVNGGEPDKYHLARPIENLKASANRLWNHNERLSGVLDGALAALRLAHDRTLEARDSELFDSLRETINKACREIVAAQGIDAAPAGETREAGLDAKHESPVAEGDAPITSPQGDRHD